MESVGYFVVTLPIELRPAFEAPAALSALGLAWRQVLENHGFERGLSRWHFFGERSEDYHPHFNALVDGGRLTPEKLAAIKADLAAVVGKAAGEISAWYGYRASIGRILHCLKYVFHPTFTADKIEGYEDLAYTFIGFRNTKYWGGGKWKTPIIHKLEGEEETGETLQLIDSICPDCGKTIKWSSEIVSCIHWEGEQVGEAGYLRLRKRPDRIPKGRPEPPPEVVEKEEILFESVQKMLK